MRHALIVGLVLFVAVIACDGETATPPPPPVEPPQQEEPPSAGQPDLVVTSIEVVPAQPQPGVPFAVFVYIVNEGDAPSGEYDLAMHISDVSRGSTYPVGTFRQSALDPGEQRTWQTDSRMVSDPGPFQYWVEIQPFLFEDGNVANNSMAWQFEVVP